MTKWIAFIILLSGLSFAACVGQAPGTPLPTPGEGHPVAGDALQVNVRTDRKAYRAGETSWLQSRTTQPARYSSRACVR